MYVCVCVHRYDKRATIARAAKNPKIARAINKWIEGDGKENIKNV